MRVTNWRAGMFSYAPTLASIGFPRKCAARSRHVPGGPNEASPGLFSVVSVERSAEVTACFSCVCLLRRKCQVDEVDLYGRCENSLRRVSLARHRCHSVLRRPDLAPSVRHPCTTCHTHTHTHTPLFQVCVFAAKLFNAARALASARDC